jgi:hypothetical protein
MTIEIMIPAEDIDRVNAARRSSQTQRYTLSYLESYARRCLKKMGIKDAEVYLLRKRGDNICWGSYRMPLRIVTKDSEFVIKPYESPSTDGGREKKVLRQVSGKLAPKVLRFGTDFYAEELIDHDRFQTLEDIADAGYVSRAVKLGAQAHADLARLSISYAHGHWFDEFHVDGEQIRVTDFGEATFFARGERVLRNWSKELSRLDEFGPKGYIREFKPIESFDETRPEYESTTAAITALTNEHVKLLNLLRVLQCAAEGIMTYFESRGHKEPWDMAMFHFPDFVRAFSARYKGES